MAGRMVVRGTLAPGPIEHTAFAGARRNCGRIQVEFAARPRIFAPTLHPHVRPHQPCPSRALAPGFRAPRGAFRTAARELSLRRHPPPLRTGAARASGGPAGRQHLLMPAPGAVFLSYASQDAEAARRISDALRAAGVEVWFDQSELRGGDAWDQKIRRQIKECALFVPIISANTQARLEGYFRLEWLLAVERSRLMAEEKAFLVPVVIDDTSDAAASVPERFRDVQWIRLSGSDTSSQFCERVNVLLAGELGARTSKSAPEMRARTPALPGRRRWLALGIAAAVTGVALAFWQPWKKTPAAAASVAPSSGTETAAPLTAAQKLTRQARALIDDDFLAVRENFRLAEELCQRATTLDPSDAEAWATHARVSVEMMKRNYDSSAARREAARSQAERAIRLAPASLEAGLAVAAHALQLHDAAEAERRYRSVLTTAPREARAAIGLAHALEAGGRISEASEIRLHHPAFASPHPVPLVDEARRLRFRGQLIEAEAFLDRAQAIAPTVGGYHAKLVILANYWGDVPAAVDYLKQIPL
ncbi:MAG: TIR domain-containing protein, partial [Verrucomicrobia bacterium]|nr:TIR domain-containing protein [Verrucomicrobiota bacterium]